MRERKLRRSISDDERRRGVKSSGHTAR